MPFGEDFKDIDLIVRYSAKKSGLKYIRGDLSKRPGGVMPQILHEIRRAAVVVADTADSKKRNLEEAARMATEKEKQHAQEESKRKAEELAQIRAQDNAKKRTLCEANRKKKKQCILCGLPLGFFNNLLGKVQHPECITWKE